MARTPLTGPVFYDHTHLRRRAQKQLKSRTAVIEKPSSQEPRDLLQELQIHHVELEMQNEQLRQTQVELETALTKYTDLYDFAPVAYLTLDDRGRILEANLTATRLLGIERSRLVQQPLAPFIQPEDKQKFWAYLVAVIQGQEAPPLELRLQGEGGAKVTVQLDSLLMPDAAGHPQVRASLIDVTPRWLAHQDLAQRNREIGLLQALGDLLQGCHTLAEAYLVIGQSLGRLFAGDSGALFIFSASRNLVEAMAIWGEVPPPEQVFAPDDCWALRRGQPQVGGEGAGAPACAHGPGQTGAYLCVPLMSHGEAIGLLHVLPAAADEGLLEEKMRLALTVAGQLGLALANLKLQENLRDMAVRDPLTGLFNRRYLEETLEREFLRAARQGAPIALIMLDIDHFKRCNDTYGHDAGDVLLRTLGVFLQRYSRGSDVACRYGGEEFVLILPPCSLKNAFQRAEEMQQALKTLQVNYGYRNLEAITLSFGVAAFPEYGDNPDAVLNAADTAMCQAKKAGRNRVVAPAPGSLPGVFGAHRQDRILYWHAPGRNP
jgi:diguanylate cyclase (GGDEF)-like protein/PAS domain S-box-containing protein